MREAGPPQRRTPWPLYRATYRVISWVWVGSLAAALVGCDQAPDPAELDRWLEEAHRAEAEAQRSHEVEDEATDWTLTVLGETRSGAPLLLRNPDLEAASTVTIGARPPLSAAEHGAFRGVRLSELVGRAGGPMPSVEEVTLVASDGFRATVAWQDVERAPIVLATYLDGVRLRREQGGPLITAFPLDDYPDLLERYTESYWVYYVTHLVVGTPRPTVRVGDQQLDADALGRLPTSEVRASVGYRVGWPSDAVRVVGPTLAEVLRAANLELPEGGRIRVLSLAPISRGPDRPTYVSAAEVESGEVLLGLAYGEDGAPIPARLGGPIVLAFSDAIAGAHPGHDWLTFVTDVRIELAAGDAPSAVVP